jgi:hypothetical protein
VLRRGLPDITLMARMRRLVFGVCVASLCVLAYGLYSSFRESRELVSAKIGSEEAIESLKRSFLVVAPSASTPATRCFGGDSGGGSGGQWKCY